MIAVRLSSFAFRGFAAIATVLLVMSCAKDDPTEPSVSGIMLAQGGGGRGPKVTEAVPPDAPQDTTLDVQVFGSGFDDGCEVTMTLDGTPSSSVRTNSTQFVNSKELLANITIDLQADTALYDVEVLTTRGKKGIGVDMFRVRLKGSNNSGGESGFPVVISDWIGAITSPTGDVVGEITNDGRLDARTAGSGNGKNATPGQELCIDLSQVSSVDDADALAVFEQRVAQDGSTMDNACSVVVMHTRNHSNIDEGKMLGQVVGAIEHAGGKIVLKDFAEDRDAWEWRLMWDGPSTGAVPPVPDLGQGVCIDHPDASTWHVYNDDDVATGSGACMARGTTSVDNIAELWWVVRVKTKPPSTVWVHVAEFVVPFRFTVTKQ